MVQQHAVQPGNPTLARSPQLAALALRDATEREPDASAFGSNQLHKPWALEPDASAFGSAPFAAIFVGCLLVHPNVMVWQGRKDGSLGRFRTAGLSPA